MKLKFSATSKWRGQTRFLLMASDDGGEGPARKVAIPKSVGQSATVSKDEESGRTAVVVSLGKKAEIIPNTLRRAGGAIVSWMRATETRQAGIEVPEIEGISADDALQALSEGLLLADYRFDRHKSQAEKPPAFAVDLLVTKPTRAQEVLVKRVENICGGVIVSRDLAHEPPNVINPVTLAAKAKTIAQKARLSCTVLDEKQMARQKMNAILAVGRGSATPPRLIVLEYPGTGKKARRPVVLVGKAITFDTGGYSIKTKDGILGMKYDKCGGMTVVGTLQAAAACRLETPVVGIIAAAENMISGDAYRPDDIIETMSGKTVQIVSADAEGRMVLCDALTYAQRKYKPHCIIDLATLTGGVVIALGNEAAGIMSNNRELEEALMESGRRVHERLWPLPLWDEYFELIKGDDSDFKNSAGRQAHAITGGIFLKQFVDSNMPWAHLDIAGMADVEKDTPFCPKGATGFGVRLLMDYLLRL